MELEIFQGEGEASALPCDRKQEENGLIATEILQELTRIAALLI